MPFLDEVKRTSGPVAHAILDLADGDEAAARRIHDAPTEGDRRAVAAMLKRSGLAAYGEWNGDGGAWIGGGA